MANDHLGDGKREMGEMNRLLLFFTRVRWVARHSMQGLSRFVRPMEMSNQPFLFDINEECMEALQKADNKGQFGAGARK